MEGVCVGAMTLHNMERGEFDFKEHKLQEWVLAARLVSTLKNGWVLRDGHGWRHCFSAPRGLLSPVAWAFWETPTPWHATEGS